MKKIFVLVVSMILGVVGASYAEVNPFQKYEGGWGPKFFNMQLGSKYDDFTVIDNLVNMDVETNGYILYSHFNKNKDTKTIERAEVMGDYYILGDKSTPGLEKFFKSDEEFSIDEMIKRMDKAGATFIGHSIVVMNANNKPLMKVHSSYDRINKIEFTAEAVGGKSLGLDEFTIEMAKKLNLDPEVFQTEVSVNAFGQSSRQHIYTDNKAGYRMLFTGEKNVHVILLAIAINDGLKF